MKKIKKTLMAGLAATVLMSSTPGLAGGSWLSAAASGAGLLYGAFMAYFNGGDVVNMIAGNLDPAQVAAEALVLYQMYNIKDKWDPKPKDEYQAAACSNGGGSGGSDGAVTYDSNTEKLPFQTASLQNVGIEAIGVGTMLAEITSAETRTKILNELAALKTKDASSTSSSGSNSNSSSSSSSGSKNNTTPGAGSCEASYSVCSNYAELSETEKEQVFSKQVLNEQDYGTAGLAHAELGLKSVQQAIANDGDSSVGKQGTSSSADNVTLVAGETTSVQDLSKLIGTGANTVSAMKIVSLMNLELAQRLNQGNMLQGSILTIEAARAFPNISGLTD
jgi:hypothetical protein